MIGDKIKKYQAVDNMKKLIPLSVTQRLIWFDAKVSKDQSRFNIGGHILITGDLNIDIFRSCVSQILEENDIFQFDIIEEDGEPFMDFRKPHYPVVQVFDRSYDRTAKDESLTWIQNDISEPFDVTRNEFYITKIFKVSATEVIWYLKIHHVLVDGYAFKLIFKKVAERYNSHLANFSPQWQTFSFADYVNEETVYRNSPGHRSDVDYWIERFQSLPEHSCNRIDVEKTSRNISLPTIIKREKYKELLRLANETNVSIFQLLLGVLFICLRKTFNKNDIAVAIPVLNRLTAADKQTIGVFMNMMLSRQTVDDRHSLQALAKSIRSELKISYKHQRFQLGELLHELKKVNRTIDRLHDLRFSFEQFSYDVTIDLCKTDVIASTHDDESDPISVYLRDYKDNADIVVDIKFNTQFVDRVAALLFVNFFNRLVDECHYNISAPIDQWTLYDKEQVSHILANESQGIRRNRSGNVLDLFQKQVSVVPRKIAVFSDDGNLSYAELGQLSDKIASRLLAALGERSGAMIPLLTTRNHYMIAGMLGIMKAGCAYVPLDSSAPVARQKVICDDIFCPFALITREYTAILESVGVRSICIEAILEESVEDRQHPTIRKNDIAYVIYTSGSSGTPKGVPITHLSLVDYAQTFTEYFHVTPSDIIAQQASISFDASIEEIFPAIARGASLVVISNNRDFIHILDKVREFNISILSTNPFLIDFISSSASAPSSLRIVISGGDVLRPEFISAFPPSIELYNTYGPTESTVCATYYKVPPGINRSSSIAIGSPVTNRNVYILDDDRRQVPYNVDGEICITGVGLSTGYLNDKTKTGSRFIPCPYEPGNLMFCTGDVGRYNSNGCLEFVGRADSQVKVNGYRIEISEIESVLSSHPLVKQSKVVVTGEGLSKKLIAYVIPNDPKTISIQDQLKEYCATSLPVYMVPSLVVVMTNFVLTSNGKIDVARLPFPVFSNNVEKILPVTAKEEAIAAIWRNLLGVEEVGVNENFFDLGGNSIKANSFVARLRHSLGIQMSLKDFFNNPFISEVSKIEPDPESLRNTLSKAPRDQAIPLTFEQERLWFLNKLNPANNSYIVPRAIRASGDFRLDIAERALNLMIERHEVLRTQFVEEEGLPVQKILPSRTIPVTVIDISNLNDADQTLQEREFITKEGNTPFDLSSDHLQRLTFIRLAKDRSLIIWCQQHLVHDGWTQGVLLNEFISLYTALLRDEKPELPALPFQYADYAVWQRGYFMGSVIEKHAAYWRSKLDGVPHVIDLPLDRPRPNKLSGRGAIERLTISAETADKVRAFSKAHGVTLYMTMLTAFKILLNKFSALDDFTVGGWFANRRLGEIENMIGMVINTLPLRTPIAPDETFNSYVLKVRDTVIEAMEHQDTPFDRIVDEMRVVRNLSHLPLVQVGFAFMDTPTRRLRLPGVELVVEDAHNDSAKLDIGVIVITPREQLNEGDIDHEVIIEMEYNSDIFNRSTIRRLLDWYSIILNAGMTSDIPIADLSLISPHDKQLFETVHSVLEPAALKASLVELFEEHAMLTPAKPAVKFGPFEFSYSYVNTRANALARLLISKGLKKGGRAGIMLQRSEHILISMLAVLKAGGVFVPMDPATPLKRIRYIVDNSKQTVLITNGRVNDELKERVQIVYPEAVSRSLSDEEASNLGTVVGPDDPIYIMYTSGSTGVPKGVLIKSQSLVSQFQAITNAVGEIKGKFLASSAITFDPSLIELLMPLTTGDTVLLTSGQLSLDPVATIRFMKKEKPDFMQGTPTFWKMIIDHGWEGDSGLTIFCGGEVLREDLAGELISRSRKLYNVYGPTETTVWSTYQLVKSPTDARRVGIPLPNVKVWIVDDKMRQQPIGIPGQICIAGSGVAIEYVDQPGLTAASFVDNPFLPGSLMYLSGDVGRWTDDGTIEFFGRRDGQVKIRGHRIELAEIESVLLRHQAIEEAIVVGIDDDDGEKMICAYYKSNKQITNPELRQYLQEFLPPQMIPSYFMEMEEFPLTSSSKVNRRALPLPARQTKERTAIKVPVTATEITIAEIWSEVLKRKDIGVNETFFELGGNSVKLIALYNKIAKLHPNKIQIHDLFTYPTISRLSEFLDPKPAGGVSAFEIIEL